MNSGFCLQKHKRLSDRQDINRVFNHANAVRHPKLILLGTANGLCHPRLAIIIAKKHVKRANQRNTLKRVIRESFRLNQHTLNGEDFVVIAKSDIAGSSRQDIFKLMEQQWQKYCKRYKH